MMTFEGISIVIEGHKASAMSTRHIGRLSMQGVQQYLNTTADPCGPQTAAPGAAEARPRIRLLTTLYDLIEAIRDRLPPDAEDLVVTTAASILWSNRITFLNTADYLNNKED